MRSIIHKNVYVVEAKHLTLFIGYDIFLSQIKKYIYTSRHTDVTKARQRDVSQAFAKNCFKIKHLKMVFYVKIS